MHLVDKLCKPQFTVSQIAAVTQQQWHQQQPAAPESHVTVVCPSACCLHCQADYDLYSKCEKSASNSAVYAPLKAAPCIEHKKDTAKC